MSLPLRLPLLFLLALSATGCSDSIESAALTVDEKIKITHLQNPFEKPPVTLNPSNGLPSATFGIKDCKVYKATRTGNVIVNWTVVIKPDFSLLPQSCERESMRIENDYLLVDTGLISFGAGGCCSATGKYRTKDGVAWERYLDGNWVEQPSSTRPVLETTSE